mgnify:CR=1 FL=1
MTWEEIEECRTPERLDLHAADIDPRAVACAEQNLVAVGGVVHQGDLFTALPRRLRRRTDLGEKVSPASRRTRCASWL